MPLAGLREEAKRRGFELLDPDVFIVLRELEIRAERAEETAASFAERLMRAGAEPKALPATAEQREVLDTLAQVAGVEFPRAVEQIRQLSGENLGLRARAHDFEDEVGRLATAIVARELPDVYCDPEEPDG